MSKKSAPRITITEIPFSIAAGETFETVIVSNGSELVSLDAIKDGQTFRLYPVVYPVAEREPGVAEIDNLFARTIAAAAHGDLTRTTKKPSGE
jgi:hypothetical protein